LGFYSDATNDPGVLGHTDAAPALRLAELKNRQDLLASLERFVNLRGESMAIPRIALVTGGNRGIGFEVCRQLAQRGFTVLLGARELAKGEQAVARCAQAYLPVLARQLDMTDGDSIARLRQHVETAYGHLDVLVNNAAILYDTWQDALTADLQVVREALDTNTFGAWRMCQAFIPLLRHSPHGRIVNVSSEAGSLTHMGGGTPAYSLSTAALNAFTRMLAAEL
jgi:NAD(P)-dependent dehydrogenase (short-subunit alcohol dehydrogenase family)